MPRKKSCPPKTLRSNNEAIKNFMWSLNSIGNTHQKNILPFLHDEACNKLYDCVWNALNNDGVANREKLKKKLEPFKSDLRVLANLSLSKQKKRKRMDEVGGQFITPILAATVPILIDFLASKLKS